MYCQSYIKTGTIIFLVVATSAVIVFRLTTTGYLFLSETAFTPPYRVTGVRPHLVPDYIYRITQF